MSESFVDLTYRGLVLGKRVKLTQVRPSSGYLELPTPMPVGTWIGIASDDGTTFEAFVTEAIEQVSGRSAVPGMTVRPRLDDSALPFGSAASPGQARLVDDSALPFGSAASPGQARLVDDSALPFGSAASPGQARLVDGAAAAWWHAKVVLPDVVKPEPAPVIGIVRSKRASNAGAVPELVDDGRNTAVQNAIDPAKLGVRADTDAEPDKDTQVIPMLDVPLREPNPTPNSDDSALSFGSAASPGQARLVDDGRNTIAMDAVDLAALGLDASISGQIPIAKDDDGDDDSKPGDSKSGPAGKKKRRRR